MSTRKSVILKSAITSLSVCSVISHGSVFAQEEVRCAIVEAAIQYENGGHEHELHCQTFDANGNRGKIFDLDNMPPGLEKAYENTLRIAKNPNAANVILTIRNGTMGKGKVRFPVNADWSVELEEANSADIDAQSGTSADTLMENATEVRTVLAIRVVANDSATTASEATISDEVFGTSGDDVNLRTQMARCSLNQVDFAPASGPWGDDGVVTVNLNMNVTGVSDGTVRNAVESALDAEYGSEWRAQNHAMFLLPPATGMGSIAYAYVGGKISVYKDYWGLRPSSQMHEIGHNIRLAHSNEGGNSYQDQTGMMGFSYNSDEGPRMCFNGAKSAQLGWYSNKQITLQAGEDFTGSLTGIVHHESGSHPHPNVIKIVNIDGSQTLYVTLNAKDAFNSDTKEAGNLVTVTKTNTASETYKTSDLAAKLGSGGSYTETNFAGDGKNVTITVGAIRMDNVYFDADVFINYDDVPPSASDMSVETAFETSISFDLQGSGAGDLIYEIVSTEQTSGSVILTGKTVAYSPASGFTGTDQFTYQVSSANEASNVSNVATVSVAVFAPKPVTPSGLVATDTGAGQVQVTWVDVENETGFVLERETFVEKGKNASWREATTKTVGADITSFTETASNGLYRYRIKAVNSSGESVFSEYVEVSVASSVDSPKKGGGNGKGGGNK